MEKTYPNKQEEVEKFVIGINKTLHDDSVRERVIAQLKAEDKPIFFRISAVVAQVMTSMLMRVRKTGRKPTLQLLIKSINGVVREVALMCKALGIEVTTEDMKKAVKLSGDMIETNFDKPQQNQQQPQQNSQASLAQGGYNG